MNTDRIGGGSGRRWAARRAVLVAVGLLAALGGCGGGEAEHATAAESPLRGTARVEDLPCPTSPRPGVAGRDYSNRTIAGDLDGNYVNANFSGARFTGGKFNGDFTGANFSNASFDSGASLTGHYDAACFKGVVGGTLYFTSTGSFFNEVPATVEGADFSNTDATQAPIVFYGVATTATLRFRNSVVNCGVLDYAASTGFIDLDGSVFDPRLGTRCFLPSRLHARSALLHGIDMSGLPVAGFDLSDAELDGATLDGTTGWNKATFARTSFRQASLKGVDFRGVQIVGVDFSGAELEGSSFAGASFPPDASGVVTQFRRAHLKYVTFEGASASKVQFVDASLYGSMTTGAPAGVCVTSSSPGFPAACGGAVTGQTCACASMSGADLAQAVFTGAFLYGVDFGATSGKATVLAGTDFSNAVLVAASFKGAQFLDAPGGAAPVTRFDGALLQGAQFDAAAAVKGVSFAGAFVDAGFPAPETGRPQDNSVYWLVGPETTQFKGWTGPARPCVHLEYDRWTTVPANTQDSVCPDNLSHPDGCHALVPNHNAAGTPVEPRWKAPTALADRQGWYRHPSTYEAVTGSSSCNGVLVSTW